MEAAGLEVTEVVAAGGMTKSRDLIQMHADVMNKPITLTEVGDAVALGSAMIAAVGAGVYTDLIDAAKNMVHEIDTMEPNQEVHEQYQFYVDKYISAFPQMADLIHDVVDHEADPFIESKSEGEGLVLGLEGVEERGGAHLAEFAFGLDIDAAHRWPPA